MCGVFRHHRDKQARVCACVCVCVCESFFILPFLPTFVPPTIPCFARALERFILLNVELHHIISFKFQVFLLFLTRVLSAAAVVALRAAASRSAAILKILPKRDPIPSSTPSPPPGSWTARVWLCMSLLSPNTRTRRRMLSLHQFVAIRRDRELGQVSPLRRRARRWRFPFQKLHFGSSALLDFFALDVVSAPSITQSKRGKKRNGRKERHNYSPKSRPTF